MAGAATVTDSIDVWGEERKQYDFRNPGFHEQTGHFTQLVWKTTTEVGCGRTFCNGNNDVPGWYEYLEGGYDTDSTRYLVCEYFPRGNVIGEFDVDVQGTSDAGSRGLAWTTGYLTLAAWSFCLLAV